jgi:hypothetical protein
MIGREGMSGMSIVLGDHQAPHSAYMQLASNGPAHRSQRASQGDECERVVA